MLQDLVSTVIPVHNRGALLREAVDSVLAQTWRPIEVIVVDDGSTDDTLMIARSLEATHPGVLRALAQANAGPGVARQTGLAECRGEFVQFLDSDDLLLPQKFSLQVAALRADPQADIAYGKTYVRHSDGQRATHPSQRTGESHRHVFPALLAGRIWETSTPLYRRAALDRIGPWPRKRQMEDWEFDAQAGAAMSTLVHCNEFVCEYRLHHEPRLAHAWMTNPAAMSDRLSAHQRILELARLAGVSDSAPEMQRFVRTLFAVAREAGAYGRADEARSLLRLACSVAGSQRFEMYAYNALTAIIGWRLLGRLVARK